HRGRLRHRMDERRCAVPQAAFLCIFSMKKHRGKDAGRVPALRAPPALSSSKREKRGPSR
ncbi:hypothetical protein, partial [uncultured Bilophila sp.]|uniref:hypothetical protein n=1 Tax=uncultured Bilophila sp. TaxID=529385 RepID=UPI002614E293